MTGKTLKLFTQTSLPFCETAATEVVAFSHSRGLHANKYEGRHLWGIWSGDKILKLKSNGCANICSHATVITTAAFAIPADDGQQKRSAAVCTRWWRSEHAERADGQIASRRRHLVHEVRHFGRLWSGNKATPSCTRSTPSWAALVRAEIRLRHLLRKGCHLGRLWWGNKHTSISVFYFLTR